MRAVIIQDSDASNLLDLIKLEKFSDPVLFQSGHMDAWHGLPESIRGCILDTVHRKFHYIVCRWLQEQGANVVRN